MNASHHLLEEHRTKLRTEAILVGIAFALLATAACWLFLDKNSPLNHGVSPDIQGNPFLLLWMLANAPANVLWISISSPRWHSETALVILVFMQWFIVGTGLGFLEAVVRRAMRRP
jgi:hypothetical protein